MKIAHERLKDEESCIALFMKASTIHNTRFPSSTVHSLLYVSVQADRCSSSFGTEPILDFILFFLQTDIKRVLLPTPLPALRARKRRETEEFRRLVLLLVSNLHRKQNYVRKSWWDKEYKGSKERRRISRRTMRMGTFFFLFFLLRCGR